MQNRAMVRTCPGAGIGIYTLPATAGYGACFLPEGVYPVHIQGKLPGSFINLSYLQLSAGWIMAARREETRCGGTVGCQAENVS